MLGIWNFVNWDLNDFILKFGKLIKSMKSKRFITLDKISVRLRDQLYLHNTSWRLQSNEHWAVLGPNGSGKTTLAKSIFGGVPVVRGKIIHHYSTSSPHSPSANFKSIGYVSSDLQRDIIEREKLQDSFRDFSGKIDEITTVADIILDAGRNASTDTKASTRRVARIAARLGISDYLRRDIKSLSIGERSKALIARALIKAPRLLILDEPFEGLDLPSRRSMAAVIDQLMQDSMRVILITHRFDEIAPNISHVLFLRNGEVCYIGKKEDILKPEIIREVYEIEAETDSNADGRVGRDISVIAELTRQTVTDTRPEAEQPLIEMKKVTIKYGASKVLDGFSWTMESDQNWAICGSAGSGKTTVLKLILGEILQAYANEIYLFGKKKGTGESIWDIR
jgi:molybdate transport system ATP-binding protein